MVVENPIPLNSMPKWIQNQANDSKVLINDEAAQLLAEKTEGNLLAATQEIIKLALLYPNIETKSIACDGPSFQAGTCNFHW